MDSRAVVVLLRMRVHVHWRRDAQYSMAAMLAQGWGCRVDPTKAAELFKDLAKRGHLQATYSLAKLYADGAGVPQSTSRAIGL